METTTIVCESCGDTCHESSKQVRGTHTFCSKPLEVERCGVCAFEYGSACDDGNLVSDMTSGIACCENCMELVCQSTCMVRSVCCMCADTDEVCATCVMQKSCERCKRFVCTAMSCRVVWSESSVVGGGERVVCHDCASINM
jgi:hypothetical protein